MSTPYHRESLPVELPEADAVEQGLPVLDDSDEPALAPPLESDPADAREQRQVVVTGDEDYPREHTG